MNPLNHVAIIMDGNGRWGLKNKNSRNAGHKKGLYTIEKIIKESIEQKIKYLTLFTFSTDLIKASITVFPVTKIVSSRIFSLSKFSLEVVVGAKW